MKRKLLNIAHNRFDNFISTKYKGLLADKIDKSSITVLALQKKKFLVNTSRDSKVTYRVYMEIGTCSCEIGINGSPYSSRSVLLFHIAHGYCHESHEFFLNKKGLVDHTCQTVITPLRLSGHWQVNGCQHILC